MHLCTIERGVYKPRDHTKGFSTRLLRNNYCKIFSELSINVERRESVKTTVQWIE